MRERVVELLFFWGGDDGDVFFKNLLRGAHGWFQGYVRCGESAVERTTSMSKNNKLVVACLPLAFLMRMMPFSEKIPATENLHGNIEQIHGLIPVSGCET